MSKLFHFQNPYAVLVAAVGNDGEFEDESRIMYPAAFANVLSVGAKNGEAAATYSNGGVTADCFASGTQILKDANGNQVSVIGTSGAAAFVAGTILKKWCIDPDKRALDIAKCIKKEMLIVCEDNAGKNQFANFKYSLILVIRVGIIEQEVVI